MWKLVFSYEGRRVYAPWIFTSRLEAWAYAEKVRSQLAGEGHPPPAYLVYTA